MYIYTTVVCVLLLCVFNCFLPTQSSLRDSCFSPTTFLMQRAGKKCKNVITSLKTDDELFHLSVCVLSSVADGPQAFPAFFFSFLFAFFFSLSLLYVTLRHHLIITKTHIQKSHQTVLSLSLSLQTKKKKKTKKNVVVVFVRL